MSVSIWRPIKCSAFVLMTAAVWSAPAQTLGGAAPTDRSLLPVTQRGTGERAWSMAWLEIKVAGATMPRPALLAKASDGGLLASADDLLRWRVRAPAIAPLRIQGKDYFRLDDIAGLDYRVDEASQVLLLSGRADVFVPTVINAREAVYSPVDAWGSGGFLNYDLQLQQQEHEKTRMNGLLELGVFNRRGFGTGTFLVRGDDASTGTTRLETAWTIDQPAAARSLRFGDSVSRAGAWGRSLRYGGLQWGTDFATRPDLVPFPLPSLHGEAQVPSMLDLYVNNVLRLNRSVPYGPFTIPEMPVFTGQGEVQMVIRDALGRENVITRPYDVSPLLLQPDRHDYTYEAGFVRRGFGHSSGDYGHAVAVATHRYGFSEWLTGEARSELEPGRQAFGLGAAWLLPGTGVLNASLAVARRHERTGSQWSAGIERHTARFSFGLQRRESSADFGEFGALPGETRQRRLTTARASAALPGFGSVFASYVDQIADGREAARFVSAGYSVGLPGNGFLSLNAQRSLSGEAVTVFGISLTWALGPRTTSSLGWTRQNGAGVPSAQLQQSVPQGSGTGYRLAATGGAHPSQEAGALWQTGSGSYRAEVARVGDSAAYRVGAAGGVALLDGGLRLSRRLDESFALVKVGDYAGVGVRVDNQPVARTDADGVALLPALRAYQPSRISIETDALPLDAEIDAQRLSATLPRRSAAVLQFPVRPARAARLRIVLDDGQPLPAGAVVRIAGQAEEFPVGWRGEAYVKGLARNNVIEARWRDQSCRFELDLPAAADSLKPLPPVFCAGVRR